MCRTPEGPEGQCVGRVTGLLSTLILAAGEGTRMTFGPGDIFIAEDVTGQGHIANAKDWVRAFIHIDP
jgi:hypothetical protein